MTGRIPITAMPSTAANSIVWFRQDLRLADNPALTAAAQVGSVLPIYILDDINSAEWAMGGASRWWLHHSLSALNESLGGRLVVMRGDPLTILPELAWTTNAQAVFWNRCYEPWRIARDTRIKERLQADGIAVHSHNSSLLWEPWQVLKSDQTPYQMFTPYYRKGCLQATAPRVPLPIPPQLSLLEPPGAYAVGQSAIDALNLLPKIPWDHVMTVTWKIGETAAQQRLHDFLEEGLQGYREGRNIPQRPNVSRLSPHLHFGEVSPNQVWAMAQRVGIDQRVEDDLDCFLSELGWREFSYYLLFHRPTLPRENLQRRFDCFPWSNDPQLLRAWQCGMTGYPLVDAGMRELWQTGYMHNRVRMVVGSFLVKNLLTHWHHGEEWFWDCLVDADLASNSASWQWIAGCGADAAPYFRVFNPVTQSEKFDPQGTYIRRYVPELAAMPDKYLHDPSSAPSMMLSAAGVVLGETYPLAIVDLKESREAALLAFKSLSA